jgi:hypothetical protein
LQEKSRIFALVSIFKRANYHIVENIEILCISNITEKNTSDTRCEMQQNVKVSIEGVEIEKRDVVVKSDVQQGLELYYPSDKN